MKPREKNEENITDYKGHMEHVKKASCQIIPSHKEKRMEWSYTWRYNGWGFFQNERYQQTDTRNSINTNIIKKKKKTPGHIIAKLLKTNYKEKI